MKRMESYEGDLTDVIKASTAANPAAAAVPQWQFPSNPAISPTCPVDEFGDPFTHLRDPLLDGADAPLPVFFHNSDMIKAGGVRETAGFGVGANNLDHEILDDEMNKRPPSIFSRMLLSPSDQSPVAAVSPPILVGNDRRTLISPVKSKGFLVEESRLQISSPRNTAIRRRKNQSKKVVCIPAPAPLGSRSSSSGEVVPSDLWAWRKYGQKPIKGSPYPRGYYRCSSSKGCPARKQVERSRTNPNMLVITYTSEHNHPWPTQRNALAGSTRSHPSKTAAAKTSPKSKSTSPEEKNKEFTTKNAAPSSSHNPAAVKEEADQELDQGFSPESYKPALPESNHSGESFFADLGEIEDDSLDMLMLCTQGFDRRDGKGFDLFAFSDWAGGGNAAAATDKGATASHGESEKGF